MCFGLLISFIVFIYEIKFKKRCDNTTNSRFDMAASICSKWLLTIGLTSTKQFKIAGD